MNRLSLASELAQIRGHLVLNARSEPLLKEVAAARDERVQSSIIVGDAASTSIVRQMLKAAVGIGELLGLIHDAEWLILVRFHVNFLYQSSGMFGNLIC
jgi:hypothetical protein